MFRSLARLLVFCFKLISHCFQLMATFGCYHKPQPPHQHRPNYCCSKQQFSSETVPNGVSNKSSYVCNGHANGSALSAPSNNSETHTHQNGYSPNANGKCGQSSNTSVNASQARHLVIPLHMLISNYICHGTLIFFGHFNDFLRRIGLLEKLELEEKHRDGYSKLYSNFSSFYIRNIIQRLINMWSHPICSTPGAYTEILEREFTPYNASWKFTGRTIRTINMGSYDYLGFSENTGPRIDEVQRKIKSHGVALCTTTNELGTNERYVQLEHKVAKFLGVEDSVVIGMGFATNALSLPCLFGPGSLVVSDQHNHASLALGCKLSGAKIRVFKHNNMRHLESILREAILNGQPKTGEKWKKIIILVEGIYSMEGTIVNLPELIRLKKRYKAYVYMDEAHSIGAMGSRGRGICDYYGCDPADVDILMGTFTKSFAAAGGYIAGRKSFIDYIRANSASFHYGNTMSPAIVEQISWILDDFLAMDKNNNTKCPLQCRIMQLRKNAHRFRQKLHELGFHIDGNDDSPVVPMLVYTPSNLKCLISKLLSKGVASTGATFPVTSLVGIRARFCLSAAHTDQMIDYTLSCLDEIGTEIGIKFNQSKHSNSPNKDSSSTTIPNDESPKTIET